MYACNFRLGEQAEKLIATQFESHHAREVFPCIDEPAAKATFELTLTAPSGETVLSNTPIKSEEQTGDVTTTVFETTPRMSTYLLAFTVGKMKYKEATGQNAVKVRAYATPDNVDLLDFSLDTAVRSIEFFEEYFGVEYPLPKLDIVALPDFSEAAMENWGLITFRESYMLVNPKTTSIESKQYVALVIAHEIAHQWFGNLVTMNWWDDLWLNESFANLMEYKAVDAMFPEWNIWKHFVNSEISAALRRDSLPNVQPVRCDVRHPDEISTLFDPSIVYAKGGSLLHMLMSLIGEKDFRAGLKAYFENHRYGNTKADDLWAAIGKASGRNVKDFMDPWLTRPGYPVIITEYDPEKENARISQERLVIGNSNVSDEPWPVPLAPSLPVDENILFDKSAEISVKADKEIPLILNHDSRSYLVAEYNNADHFNSILKAIGQNKVSGIDRLVLLQSYTLLERSCRTSTTSNLEILKSFIDEREEPVWSSMSVIIGTTRRLVFGTPGENIMKQFTASLVTPLVDYVGWDKRAADTPQTERLRELALSLGASAEISDIINEGMKRFQAFTLPGDLAPDIRNAVYYIGVRFGGNKEFSKMLDLYKTLANADEKEEISSALASTKDQKQIAILLDSLKTADVRLQDLPTWFAHLISNPYAKEAAWQWMVNNWAWLKASYGEDKSYDKFPRYSAMAFSRQDELKKYTQFFEPMKRNVELERIIQLGIEEIAGRVQWRDKNETETIQWLQTWEAQKA